MISVVCVFNSKKILQNYLLKSLKNQNIKFELVLLDNTKGRFKSTADALNHGGRRANGKYIMFVHQDVELRSPSWLEKCEGILDKLPNLGIAGVAGKCEGKKGVLTNVKHGIPPRPIRGIRTKEPIKVQTLDECLVIVPKRVFNLLQFDGKTCNGWHLYAVDYCLAVKRIGFNAYVIPMEVYHLSTGLEVKSKGRMILDLGLLSRTYYPILENLLKKYKENYRVIYTTGGNWYTHYPLILQRIGMFLGFID